MNQWQPIGGYNFTEDRTTLPPSHTIAPAFAQGFVQLLDGEPAALSEVATAIKQHAGSIDLVRLVCEVSGGTVAEGRIHCQLAYGQPGSLQVVEVVGAREELTEHPAFIGETLGKLAREKSG